MEAFEPDFLNRDMGLFTEYLVLEEWQQPIVESLLKDYLADHKVGVDGLRETLKNMKDTIIAAGDQGAIGVIMGPINAWSVEKARLKERFVDNLRSQLSEEQMSNWPRLERAMRREKELPRGVLSGEAVNLLQVSRDTEIPPEVMDSAKTQLEEYTIGLDNALVERAKQMAKSQDAIKTAMIAQDFATGLEHMERIVAKRVALRDFQEQSIDVLAAAYGDQYGPMFKQRALAAAYPKVFRANPMISYFAAARELPGLSPGQVEQLNALEVTYLQDHAALEGRMVVAYRSEEPKKQTEETRRRLTRGTAAAVKPTNDICAELYQERDALNERIRDEIAKIVGPDLAEQLPGAAKRAAAEAHPLVPPKPGTDIPTLTPSGKGEAPRGSGQRGLNRQGERGGDRPNNAPNSIE